MDSHSRSASPREPMRPLHRPPSPPSSPGAFDNRAYQHDDADPNHNDSFTSNGPQQNGHSKEPNGDTKLPEAVNLELINLTPKNGTKKKDVEVDMNASNPYDEYFVPVNEHRKFMRGEKLYVTADKRGEKGGCKRPLCWTLLVLVVAAIVAIIVLAATGILFSNSSTTLEQYNTSISSARALGGIGGHTHDHDHNDHDHDHAHHDHDNDHDHFHTTVPTPTQHGPDTQNDAPVQVIGSDENDMSLYVPRTVEGELTIDNEEFTSALEDSESPEYREFVNTFTDGLKRALFDRNTLENGENDVIVEVVKLRKGSVIVTYRIHWKPKSNVKPTSDLLTAESLKSKLDKYLDKNNRMINVYHVSEDNMPTKPVLDICQVDNNHCENGCEFDQTSLEFTCTCPHGQILDNTNPKKCMSILENTYPLLPTENTKQEEVKELQTDTNSSITKPVLEEKTIPEPVSVVENVFDWKEPHNALPETTTESDADLNLSHIFGYEHHVTEALFPEPSAEPLPEPTAEPKTEPEPSTLAKAAPESTTLSKTVPEPTAEPESTAEPKPEPEPTSEPKLEPEPAAEPKVELEPTAEPKTEPEPTAEPKAEPESTPEPKSEPEPTAEPIPITQPEPEPTTEKAEQAVKSIVQAVTGEPNAEPTAEPTAEPLPEPEPKTEPSVTSSENTSSEHKIVGIEVIHIPTNTTESAPLPIFEPESTSEPQAEPKPTSEPSSPSVETAINPNTQLSEDQIVNQSNYPTASNSFETVTAAPVSEEKLEYHTERDGNLKPMDEMDSITRVSISEPHIINEPSYEPKPEIISILNERKKDENVPKLFINGNIEPTTEQNEWLQGNLENDMSKSNKFQNNYMINDHNDSEQRSFKSFDIFSEHPTTDKKEEQDILSGVITEEYELAMTEINRKDNEETTTLSTDSAKNKNSDRLEPASIENIEKNNSSNLVTKDLVQKRVRPEILQEDNSTVSNAHAADNNETSSVFAATHEGRSLDSNDTTATIAPREPVKDYSISEPINSNSTVEKYLMEALEKGNKTKLETTTDKIKADDGMDITFDTINMLYNQSSASIQNETKQNESEPKAIETNDGESSTVSDWLFEPVTEINFDEVMNAMEKHGTTEPNLPKIDKIINSGMAKDDFEPDYLNNMSSNNNKLKEDEPLYGMSHDYDSEDFRVKRVNKEKEVTTEKKVSNETAVTQNNIENGPALDETTTVIEYIYKTTENIMNVSLATSSTEKSEPAPVWEDSETEKDLTVKKLEMPVGHIEEESTTVRVVSIDDITVPINASTATILTTTTAPTTVTLTSNTTPETGISITKSNMQDMPRNESDAESQTQVNNLNVTIYEISSHNGNNSFAVTNQHSGEFVDHETEMNPFLPEVENNKSLVKKLQEGHDIEPTNFNETQNENAEDHSNNTLETNTHITNNNSSTTLAKADENKNTTTAILTTTEGQTNFSKLMDKEINTEKANDIVTTVPISEKSKSNFFLDTDDLDNDKEHTTEHKTTIAENNLENGGITPSPSSPVDLNDESDYLSVVPIEEERLEEKEALKKDYGSELNDISDSPKKSDRRTLDETKFDTVNDNEA